MSESPASSIFISYRRDDTAGHAGRVYDATVARFGEAGVFMDVDMQPGVDFVDRITETLRACRVVLVLMGPGWADPAEGETSPRIADPQDLVRREVAMALLRSDVTVIPLLVAGAAMPDAADLPEDLRALARRNGLELSDMRWRYDIGRLMSALDQRLTAAPAVTRAPPALLTPEDRTGKPPGERPGAARRRARIAVLLGLLTLAVVAVLLLIRGDPARRAAPATAGRTMRISPATPGNTPRAVHVALTKAHPQTLTFQGTRGERVVPDVRNVTGSGAISIIDPADEMLLGPSYGFQTAELMRTESCAVPAGCPLTLKRTGRHRIVVHGTGDTTGSADLRLYEAAPDLRRQIRLGAPAISLALGVGQAALLTFPSTRAGARISLRVTNSDLQGFVNVRDPAGQLVWRRENEVSNSSAFGLTLSRRGPYTIYLWGNGISFGALRVGLAAR